MPKHDGIEGAMKSKSLRDKFKHFNFLVQPVASKLSILKSQTSDNRTGCVYQYFLLPALFNWPVILNTSHGVVIDQAIDRLTACTNNIIWLTVPVITLSKQRVWFTLPKMVNRFLFCHVLLFNPLVSSSKLSLFSRHFSLLHTKKLITNYNRK